MPRTTPFAPAPLVGLLLLLATAADTPSQVRSMDESRDESLRADGADAAGAFARPLAQDYTIAAQVPKAERFFIHDPGMTRLPSGRFLAVSPCWERGGGPSHLIMSRSDDGGRAWERLPDLPHAEGTPFVVNGTLYMFTQPRNHDGVYFTRSDDEGQTWTAPVRVIDGPYWNCQTGMAVRDGHLYWALDAAHQEIVAVAADLSQDLLTPAAWRVSNRVRRPEIPPELTRRMYPPRDRIWSAQWGGDVWLEPNVVSVAGDLRVLLRVVGDEYSTAGLAGVCDLEDDGTELKLSFAQFHPLPGGQNKFCILYDDKSRLFWMASNLPSDAQDSQGNRERLKGMGYHGGPGNERRFLMLWYGIDALNWFPAGCIAMWPSPVQSFMYPSMVFDGDDLCVLSRTSRDSGNQHDADLATFHRVRSFRELAMDLWPRFNDVGHGTQPPGVHRR